MNINAIRKKARELGLETAGKKANLIHAIQRAEGYEDCFGSRDECAQTDCCWRKDCLSGKGR